jgi:threonine synthase
MPHQLNMAKLTALRRAKLLSQAPDSLDALIATKPEHITYAGGYKSMGHDTDRAHRMAALVTRNGVHLVGPAADFGPAMETLEDPADYYSYGRFVFTTNRHPELKAKRPAASSYVDAVVAAVADKCSPGARIGLDCSELGVMAAPMMEALSHYSCVDATNMFAEARATKLAGELELLQVASSITECGIEAAFAHAQAGMSERELAAIITAEIVRGGGIPGFVVVTSGTRSALSDTYPSAKRLVPGDLVRVDVGCTVDGYWSDTARTAIVGEPEPDVQRCYTAIAAGEQAQLDMIRPGVSAAQLFSTAIDVVRSAGLPDYDRHHCGHGIGLESFEYPKIGSEVQGRIAENMVLCVETPFYELGWGGMMVEDTVVVTSNGCTSLTRSPRQLYRGVPMSTQELGGPQALLVGPPSCAIGQISLSADRQRYPLFPLLIEGCPLSRTSTLQLPVEVEYDLTRIDPTIFSSHGHGIDGYSPILPPLVRDIALGEGDTPLILAEEFGSFAGFSAAVFVKDESQNPTWSHKDRLNRITVSAAILSGAPGIVVSSSGNHGISAAAYAAKAQLPCILITVAGVNPMFQSAMRAYGAAAIAVPADARWGLMRRVVDELGYHPVSNITECHTGHAFGPEGYKSIAYELYRDLQQAPAAIFVPTGYGELLFGIHKGFVELRALGLITTVPTLFSVEPEARGPLAQAFRRGLPVAQVPPGLTNASSIACTVSSYRGVVALKGSGGQALLVSDKQLVAAQSAMARCGFFAELSGAAGLAGLKHMVEQGYRADGPIVVLQTSSGLKDPVSTKELVPLIEPTWDGLRSAMRTEYGL